MSKVVVTGIGVVSAIGNDVASNLAQLKRCESGIGKAHHFSSKYVDSLNFAEVKLSDEELKAKLNLTGQNGISRTALLASLAFKEAISQANLSESEIRSYRTGFISSSTVGGMCNTDELYADANLKGTPSEYVGAYGGGEHTLRIVEQFGIKGFTSTINTACSSSANAIMLGSRLIKSGRLDRVIVGGADSLAKYTVNGFNALMILSSNPCKPFDNRRDGLTLGEGAGYLVLERQDLCNEKEQLAEVSGYGNANDAFHPSATSDEAFGPRLAMERALKAAKLDSSSIDYINAHGTGTPNNDKTEMFAFHKVFGKIPPYNSTKSYTGHTLAASGAIESIFSILSIMNKELYPSLQCEDPITDYDTTPIQEIKTLENLNIVMSNSFGFGGNCTSVIFSKA
ncbi:MAG: beta-ketoacyl-[acyl-carrier-protein] synthase family protein [Crocinitomicaceae bacterium]|nr:beta-ketoacyl-[acyl-carrier-protein] synthase family protein [Crocinitomicaceae bacterium]